MPNSLEAIAKSPVGNSEVLLEMSVPFSIARAAQPRERTRKWSVELSHPSRRTLPPPKNMQKGQVKIGLGL